MKRTIRRCCNCPDRGDFSLAQVLVVGLIINGMQDGRGNLEVNREDLLLVCI